MQWTDVERCGCVLYVPNRAVAAICFGVNNVNYFNCWCILTDDFWPICTLNAHKRRIVDIQQTNQRRPTNNNKIIVIEMGHWAIKSFFEVIVFMAAWLVLFVSVSSRFYFNWPFKFNEHMHLNSLALLQFKNV